MVTGGGDGRVQLWPKDSFKPEKSLRLEGPASEVVDVAISPSGTLVTAADADGYIHLWETGLDNLIDRACQAMNRNLTIGEWEHYLKSYDYVVHLPRAPSRKRRTARTTRVQ